MAGIAEESQQPNKNEAFNEDIEELKEDSLVLWSVMNLFKNNYLYIYVLFTVIKCWE